MTKYDGLKAIRVLPILLILSGLENSSVRAQVNRPASSVAKAIGKSFDENAPSLELQRAEAERGAVPLSSADAQRATAYNSISHQPPLYDRLTGKVTLHSSSVDEFDPNPLPVGDSDLVAIGYLPTASVHLSADGTTVYTSYAFRISNVLKGNSALISKTITVDREGGVVVLPDGSRRFVGVEGWGEPEPKHTCLLFLKNTPVAGVFTIQTGYILLADKVSAFDRRGDGLDKLSPSALLRNVRLAIK